MPLVGQALSNPDGTIVITFDRYRGRAAFSVKGTGLEQVFAQLGKALPRNRMISAEDLQTVITSLGLTPQEE